MEIVILVGLKGVGKTTLARALAERGWPTIEPGGEPLEQIQHLEAAGQKHVALDGISAPHWREIFQAYPNAVTTIGVVAPKQLRRRRLKAATEKNLSDAEILECDRIELEELGVGNLLAGADFYILNATDPEAAIAQLLAVLPTT